MAKIGGPPILRRLHEVDQILLQGFVIEGLKGSRVVKIRFHGIAQGRVLTKNVQVQLIGPPVLVARAAARSLGGIVASEWALSLGAIDVV